MFQTRQRGTPLEMGRQLGLGLKQAGMKLGPRDPRVLRFARRCEELVAQHAPELLGEARKVDVEAVKQALRDHQGLVCSHGAHFPERKFGTLWSAVGRPGERWLEIAAGNPCTTEYERRTF